MSQLIVQSSFIYFVKLFIYLIYAFQPSVSSFTPTPLPISLSPSSSKGGGKVKSARSTSHYTQRDRGDEERSENQVMFSLTP